MNVPILAQYKGRMQGLSQSWQGPAASELLLSQKWGKWNTTIGRCIQSTTHTKLQIQDFFTWKRDMQPSISSSSSPSSSPLSSASKKPLLPELQISESSAPSWDSTSFRCLSKYVSTFCMSRFDKHVSKPRKLATCWNTSLLGFSRRFPRALCASILELSSKPSLSIICLAAHKTILNIMSKNPDNQVQKVPQWK